MKNNNNGSFKLLMSYVLADKSKLAVTLLFVFVATGFEVLGPMLSKVFIDEFIMPDRYPLLPVLGVISAFIISNGLATYLKYQQTLRFLDLALTSVLDIRQRVFNHVMRLPMAYFDYARTGQLVSRITNDTESIKDIYVQFLSSVVANFILLIGILGAMAILDPQLMVIALILIPAVVGLIFIYQKFSVNVVTRSRQLRSDINATMNESISGMSVIQATNQQSAKMRQFDSVNDEYYTTRLKTVVVASLLLRPAINLLSILILGGVVWFFGRNVVEGVVEVGVLYAYLNYLARFTEPLVEITQRFGLYQQAIVAGDRVFELLQEPQASASTEEFKAVADGHLTIDNVFFSYQANKDVLKNITVDILPGSFYAIVGHTGSGKSTLLSLLLNFYAPKSGEIRLDNHTLSSYAHDTLRSAVGFIPQEPFILASSIYENIDMGRGLTLEQISSAAKKAFLHEVIMEMKEGYDTHLGEGGLRLSTGQRQQLVIARALAGNPKVLLLDEATANVDSETEQVVQRALTQLQGSVTLIVVAHRLSTIQHADQILVLDKGQLIEQGNHHALMAIDHGRYRAMYNLQQQAKRVASLEI